MTGGVDRRLPRSSRLRRSDEFRRVQDEGRRVEVPHLVVRWAGNAGGAPRFGLAVSRRVGNAVVRNRVKRWLREALRHERGDLGGVDVVVIARPSAAEAGHAALRASVAQALGRIRGPG